MPQKEPRQESPNQNTNSHGRSTNDRLLLNLEVITKELRRSALCCNCNIFSGDYSRAPLICTEPGAQKQLPLCLLGPASQLRLSILCNRVSRYLS